MNLKDYMTEAVSGRLSAGRKKYQKLSGRELNHDNIVDFLDMCGYERVDNVMGLELLRYHLDEKVYSTDRPRTLGVESFKIVVGKDIYYVTIPETKDSEPFIKKHSRPFDDISVEELEKEILDND